MERIGSTGHNIKNNSRISHTLSSKTSTYTSESGQGTFSHTSFKRNVRTHRQDEKSKNSGNCQDLAQFYITPIPGSEKRRDNAPDIQLKSPERVCTGRSISPHKHVPNTHFSSGKRLAMQDRFVPGIFSPGNISRSQALPTLDLRARVTRNDLSTLRVKYSPQNLLNPDQLDRSNITREERENSSVSRRLFNCSSKCKSSTRACHPDHLHSSISRLANKFRKVCSHTSEERNLSGYRMGPLGQPEGTPRKQVCHHCQKSKRSSRTKKCHHKRSSESGRTSELCQFCGTKRSAKSSSTGHVPELATSEPNKRSVCHATTCKRGALLVGPELSSPDALALPSAHPLPDNRCVGPGLGRPTKQSCSLRRLVQGRTNTALQSKRNACNTARAAEPCPSNETQLHSDAMRQQDSGILFAKRGRNEISSVAGNNLPDITPSRLVQDRLQHSSHSRQVQQPCRSSVQASATARVAPPTAMHGDCIQKVWPANDRPVCIGGSPCGVQLCNPRPKGSPSGVSRRIQCSLELPSRVDFPSTIPNTEGSGTSQPVIRNVPDSSPSLAPGVLARRSQSPISRSPVHIEELTELPDRHIDRPATSERRRDDTRSMEVWGWSEQVESWNPEQLSLLKDSWRLSTLKTYEVAWKRWLSWSKTNNINPHTPSGSDLAKFLADLHLVQGFAYNTILLHKSVVSTLCNVDTSSVLSSHVLVKHILKSIALKKPMLKKSPIWDATKLSSFLSDYV